jgi:CrcB protein
VTWATHACGVAARQNMIAFLTHPVVLLTVGGAVGTNARYWLAVYLAHWYGPLLAEPYTSLRGPLAIFVINVTGSLLLALLVVPLREHAPHWWILFGVGFCGGYTTFSSFALDTVELVRKHHQPGLAVLNIVASVIVSCVVVWLAVSSMERIHPPEPPVMEAEDPEMQKEP